MMLRILTLVLSSVNFIEPVSFVKGTAENLGAEFVYNEHPAVADRFLYIEIIDCNVKKFNYNEHPVCE